MTGTILPGDRVMVVDPRSFMLGEAGEVKAVTGRVVRVLLDGEDEPVVFLYQEVEKLP